MSEPARETPEETVHQLDTRLAELGAGLRRLFSPVLDEEIPLELAALSDELEQRLNGRASDMEASAPHVPSPPATTGAGSGPAASSALSHRRS